jgi:transcriptional regulator with XRE-family HTH domain
MENSFLRQASKECAHVDSFGEVLDRVRKERRLTQEQFGKRLARGKADTNRWLKSEIPNYLKLSDIEKIAADLECSREEFAELVRAYTCYLLNHYELLNLDVFE